MVKLPETKNSILELNNSWLTFWFNRPEKRNALSSDLLEDIRNTLSAIKEEVLEKLKLIVFYMI